MGQDLAPRQAEVLSKLNVATSDPLPRVRELLSTEAEGLSRLTASVAGDPEFEVLMGQADPGGITAGGMPIPALVNYADVLRRVGPLVSGPIADDVNMSGKLSYVVGDLKVVKQRLVAYVPGEVADIINILPGEKRERTHRRLDRNETTLFDSTETNTESEKDNQSTDRFELKDEASTTIKESTDLKAGVQISGSYGPVTVTASGEYATANAKEQSSKSSSDFAHEVVSKSVEKIQTKIRTERTVKTISEVEETNLHQFEGEEDTPTVGIYRWVDKEYEAQMYDYGPHLMVEIVLPEPSAYYRAVTGAEPDVKVTAQAPVPFKAYYPAPIFFFNPKPKVDPFTTPRDKLSAAASELPDLQPSDITEDNYLHYVGLLGATDVLPPDPLYKTVSCTLTPNEGTIEAGTAVAVKGEDKFAIPSGYQLMWADFGISAIRRTNPKLFVQILDTVMTFRDKSGGANALPSIVRTGHVWPRPDGVAEEKPSELKANKLELLTGPVPVSVSGYDLRTFAANFQLYCKRTEEKYTTWQLEVYKKLRAAWTNQQTAYDQAVKEAKAAASYTATVEGRNPRVNKKIIEDELKKLCVVMMTGEHFARYGALIASSPPEVDPLRALQDGRISQFFEQAFEWENMTYLFYPYFWGKKSRWSQYQYLSDTDPLFQSFLNAGAVRVNVPVNWAYNDDVEFLLTVAGKDLSKKVWHGGLLPTIGDKQYISIADEKRAQTAGPDVLGEGEIYPRKEGKPWTYTVPTTLVWVQQDRTPLPTYPDSKFE